MKKLLLIPVILASFFLCACQSGDSVDYTSELKLNINHIDEADKEKVIHISYPVFGGIENKEAITIINTSLGNFVDSQYKEFQNALTTKEQDALSSSEALNIDKLNAVGSDGSATTKSSVDGDTTDTSSDNSDNNSDNSDSADSNSDSNSSDNSDNSDNSATKTKSNKDAITLSMTFKITYNKNNYLCIVQTYDKNLGNNMEFNGQRSFFFSLENATYLSLGEIFDFSNEEFTAYINNKINKDLAAGAYTTYDDNSGFTGISKNSKFYIDSNNLYIYYDALEISPDKETIPIFAFKLSDVKKYLNDGFTNIF